jgi:hypothetical protein
MTSGEQSFQGSPSPAAVPRGVDRGAVHFTERRYDLNRFNGLGPDFDRDRKLLEQHLKEDAGCIFDSTCKDLARSDGLNGGGHEQIARMAMRVLIPNLLADE